MFAVEGMIVPNHGGHDDRYWEAVVLTAFGDESSDARKERVFVVVSVVGDSAAWKKAEGAWRPLLKGRVFHAADCESGHGAFKDTPHDENLELYAALSRALSESGLFGYAHGIDLIAEAEVFGGDILPDSAYYYCFGHVVRDCARFGYLSIPQEPVSMTFDIRHDSEYSAALLYDRARTERDWSHREFVAPRVSFASRDDIGVQIADLFAREAMKHLDNTIGPQRRAIRRSLIALLKSRRFRLSYYLKPYLETLKREVRETPLSAQMWRDYGAWLERRGVLDSQASRVSYLWSEELTTGQVVIDSVPPNA